MKDITFGEKNKALFALWACFFQSYTKIFLKSLKKIKSFWSKCLKIHANEHCYGKFWYNCKTNDWNV